MKKKTDTTQAHGLYNHVRDSVITNENHYDIYAITELYYNGTLGIYRTEISVICHVYRRNMRKNRCI